MNKNNIITAITFVFILFMVWWFWPKSPDTLENPVSDTELGDASEPPYKSNISDSSDNTEEIRNQSIKKKQAAYINRARVDGLITNRPINFYGQIIDQNNQPVVGVKVEIATNSYGNDVLPGLMPQHKKFERISDNSGRFSVQNEKGMSLPVNLTPHPGYDYNDQDVLGLSFRDVDSHTPAPTISSQGEPHIFHAYKLSQAETLIQGACRFYKCIPDGRFYNIDLQGKNIYEGEKEADLKISIQRPIGDAQFLGHNDYDWSVKIQGEKFYIMETQDRFMYSAPASGYSQLWSYSWRAGQTDYKKMAAPKFYLKSQDNSIYGRIEFEIKSKFNDNSSIMIKYWLNPSGSRNLEPNSP